MMKKSICEHLLEVMPKVTEFTDLRSSYIANCVFNTFLSCTAIMLNIVTIHAITKKKTLTVSLRASHKRLIIITIKVKQKNKKKQKKKNMEMSLNCDLVC